MSAHLGKDPIELVFEVSVIRLLITYYKVSFHAVGI
jgi:hypothetical protein